MSWTHDDFDDASDENPRPEDLETGGRIAIVTCPECGGEMADDAEVCPRCGCWVRSGEFPRRVSPWFVAIAVVALVGLLVLVLGNR